MNTPWGKADQVTKIEPGVSWVSTPSHGGLMIANGTAAKYLTPKAIEFGERYGSYVAFEEDCAYAIAFFQNPNWKRFLDKHSLAEWECSVFENDSYMGKAKASAVPKLQTELAKTDDAIREDMRAIVESWYPEFFGNSSVDVLIKSIERVAFAKHDNSGRLGFNYTFGEVSEFEAIVAEQAHSLRERVLRIASQQLGGN
jgi:Domain of unknown function (DUF7007)